MFPVNAALLTRSAWGGGMWQVGKRRRRTTCTMYLEIHLYWIAERLNNLYFTSLPPILLVIKE